ncbi:MAG: hypothetical protein NC204_07605 [Candidatus Amulumruptor caecigallinarius]|nr:hypothetical protein [Candidatus Amulumruptor caecigallinarius]
MRKKSDAISTVAACRTLIDRMLVNGVPAEAVKIYDGRNKLYKYRLPSGEMVNIKAFRRPGVLKGLIYGIFTTPKSEKSYRNACELLKLGISTPTPYAHGEKRAWFGLKLEASYYVCHHEDNVEEVRFWEKWEDRDKFVEALGAEMSHLFKQGVFFRDFSPGNVLLASRKPYKFIYVDVNRTTFNVKSRRKMMQMFKRINIVPAETERLARVVARNMGWNQDYTVAEALQILKKFLWKKDSLLRPVKTFFYKIFKP